jgi:ABC-type multidrug transport system permease subunit
MKGGEIMRKRILALVTALALVALVVLPASAAAGVITPGSPSVESAPVTAN